MKCEIIKDLLPMYVEEMCSQTTIEEIEKHIDSCPECKKCLDNYTKELDEEKYKIKRENKEISKSEIKPMYKINRRMKIRKVSIVVLIIILIAVLGSMSYLMYGELTNKCMSFSMAGDIIELNKITKEFAKGNSQALLDIMEIDEETELFINYKANGEGLKEYKNYLKTKIDDAYNNCLKDKKIKIKIIDIFQLPYDEVDDSTNLVNMITYGFYEENQLKYSLSFIKGSDDKYEISGAACGKEYETKNYLIGIDVPGNNHLVEWILGDSIEESYNSYISGKTEKTCSFYLAYLRESKINADDPIHEAIQKLYDKGWYFKKSMYSIEEFDMKNEKWNITVWYYIENEESQASCILEEKVYYSDNKLMEESNIDGKLICVEGKIPKEIESILTSLYK